MKPEELSSVAEAVGLPAAIVIFIGYMIFRNGKWRLIIRGERDEEISTVTSDVRELQDKVKDLDARQHEAEKEIAVLHDRWKRP